MAALVLGIIGSLFGLIPLLFFIAMPCGLLAFVFGFAGRRRTRSGAPHKGMATAGLVLGAISVALGVAGIAAIGNAVDELESHLNSVSDDHGSSAVVSGTGTDMSAELTREAQDVDLAGCSTDQLGFVLAAVTVTNHSSERSNYMIEVTFESNDGARQYGSGVAFVNGLETAQATSVEANSFSSPGGEFVCQVTDVERFSDE